MTLFQHVLLVLILFICVYTLIDRICKCVEHCATAKAFGKFRENGVLTSFENVQNVLEKLKGTKKNVETGTDKK